EDQGPVDCRTDRARHPVDSRRNLGQQIVFIGHQDMATATEVNALEAKPRTPGTKNDARRGRRDGQIPAVGYGAGKDAAPVSVDPRVETRILNSKPGHNTIFDLTLDGELTKAMIVDWQYEPLKGSLLHIDLKRIAMDKKLTVEVPIVLTGVAEGVKTQGGIMEQLLRE